jgi:hypothetical protein
MTIRTPKSWAWLFDFITMMAVILGLIYGAMELRALRASQEREAVLELHRTIQTPEYVRALNFLKTVPEGLTAEELRQILEEEDMILVTHLRTTWEDIGIMVYRKDVSIAWVDEFYRFPILSSWEKLGPLVFAERTEFGYSGVNEWFQWIAERLQERYGGQEPIPAYEAYRNWTG